MPTGRYDRLGDLYLDFPPDLTDSTFFPLVRLELTRNIQPEHIGWDESGDTLWCSWRWARTVEQRARQMWPALVVQAAANPGYGQGVAAMLIEVR